MMYDELVMIYCNWFEVDYVLFGVGIVLGFVIL